MCTLYVYYMCTLNMFFTLYIYVGQEYDSLYISTCEPTHPSGETRNPTKSICDPLIFNTALTRARSLIVSFGNPYLLLSIEEHMNQTYSGGGRCWSQYMLKCLHRGTLIIHDSIIKHPNEQGKYKEKLMLTLESIHPIAAKEHINAGKTIEVWSQPGCDQNHKS